LQDLGVHSSQLRGWVQTGGRSAACFPREGAAEAGAVGDRAAQARGHLAQCRYKVASHKQRESFLATGRVRYGHPWMQCALVRQGARAAAQRPT